MPRRQRRRAKRGGVIADRHRWKLSLLAAFVRRFGWEKLKRDTVVPPGVRLNGWVTTRRFDYRSNKIADWLVVECEQIPDEMQRDRWGWVSCPRFRRPARATRMRFAMWSRAPEEMNGLKPSSARGTSSARQ